MLLKSLFPFYKDIQLYMVSIYYVDLFIMIMIYVRSLLSAIYGAPSRRSSPRVPEK